MAAGLVEEVFSVREEEREAMSRFSSRFVQLRDRSDRTSGRGDTRERFAEVWLEDDHAVSAPRPAPSVRSVADCQDGTARRVDLLQLSAAEETDRLAVG